MITANSELYGFVLSFVGGCVLAFCLQLTGFGRRVYYRRPLLRLGVELSGIAVCFAIISLAVMIGSAGLIRLYMFLGLGLGIWFYIWTMGSAVTGLLLRLRPMKRIVITENGRQKLSELSGRRRKNENNGELS